MRTFVVAILVFAVMMIAVVKIAFPSYESVAEKRTANILNGMQDGTGTSAKVETAMCMWAAGAYRLSDQSRLSWASDHFDQWRHAKKLYRKIGDYKIEKVELVPDAPEETAIVTVKIEGDEYKMRVPKDHAVSWAE